MAVVECDEFLYLKRIVIANFDRGDGTESLVGALLAHFHYYVFVAGYGNLDNGISLSPLCGTFVDEGVDNDSSDV